MNNPLEEQSWHDLRPEDEETVNLVEWLELQSFLAQQSSKEMQEDEKPTPKPKVSPSDG
jgi:hypothetical protein